MERVDGLGAVGKLSAGITALDTAHELNNLLTVMLGGLEQLHRQPLNDRGKAQLERAQWGVTRAGQLLQQLAGTEQSLDAPPAS